MSTDMTQFPEASRPFAEQLERRTARLLNIHAGMAASPAVIAAFAGLSAGVAKHATFGTATREAIALAVGNQNGCDYCQAAHTVSAKRAGLTDEQILQIRAGEVTFDPKLAALLEVARAAAANTGTVPAEVRDHASAAGWSDEELQELFAHLAVNLYTNFFNHYAGTELDFPSAPSLT
ncbi:carboxymuconolactone decarboxylase family protein [Curtobacterium sp. ISL-83]|uniref:carboxymuconolactone decarboxylase family protein n=1 Tax=Curtobacterium sp. ISL-83 TaxID=2819145 RepID=UPI001BE93453|nr:carboxymuconolactone decarboxylase family protein [Curtobacterium sp. ISL-83]MBT2502886.1 carboxymuconolactone decarboxylase family protein [Curtobacterium sp. ISL-83]